MGGRNKQIVPVKNLGQIVRGKGNAAARVAAAQALLPKRQDSLTERDPEMLAHIIKDVGRGMDQLLASGLNRKAVIVLLKDRCQTVSKKDIEKVLDELQTLAKHYTR